MCIQKQPDPSELGGGVDSTNWRHGVVDGYTYFNWGLERNEGCLLHKSPVTEEYVKVLERNLIIFPNWLRHSVNPFFGEGTEEHSFCKT